MRRLLSLTLIAWLISFLALSGTSWGFACVYNVSGGNWSASGTWTGCNSTIPQNGDTVTVASGISSLVIDAATNTIASFSDAAAAQAVTISGSGNLNVSGPLTLRSAADTWSNSGTLTLTAGASTTFTFAGVSMGNTAITLPNAATALTASGENDTFSNLTITVNPVTGTSYFNPRGNMNVTGTFTWNGNCANGSSIATGCTGANAGNIIGVIRDRYSATKHTITAGTPAFNGAVTIQGINGVCSTGAQCSGGLWDLSGIIAGNAGNNSGITFRTPTKYYMFCGTASGSACQDYGPIWTQTPCPGGGTVSGGNCTGRTYDSTNAFPLPQDSVQIDNFTWTTGSGMFFHAGGGGWIGNIDASNVTNAQSFTLPRIIMGNVIYTGSGITVPPSYPPDDIDTMLNGTITITLASGAQNIGSTNITIAFLPGDGASGTVILGSPMVTTGTFTVGGGTFSPGGYALSSGAFSLAAGTLDLRGGSVQATGFTKAVSATIKDTSPGSTTEGVYVNSQLYWGLAGF